MMGQTNPQLGLMTFLWTVSTTLSRSTTHITEPYRAPFLGFPQPVEAALLDRQAVEQFVQVGSTLTF